MIVSKDKIVDMYKSIFCLYQNDFKRIAHIHIATGVHTDEIVKIINELEE